MMFCIPCAWSGGLNHPAVNDTVGDAVNEVPTKVIYIYKPKEMARSVEEQSGVEEGQGFFLEVLGWAVVHVQTSIWNI